MVIVVSVVGANVVSVVILAVAVSVEGAIVVSDLVWEDLDRPLWSALVARLRISVSRTSWVSGQSIIQGCV